ncbi:hypothetical protein ETAA8_65250 [Anatilimnocola aggregata]|uniref:Uncharacterized protein n=1 Tax=Anatilimnocola aggregata TaxID=2528021 RepID=A0A517YMB1_9BACT|nr:hypothetical protein ETAA8_65250 [Anatilimnocola aggregata]
MNPGSTECAVGLSAVANNILLWHKLACAHLENSAIAAAGTDVGSYSGFGPAFGFFTD